MIDMNDRPEVKLGKRVSDMLESGMNYAQICESIRVSRERLKCIIADYEEHLDVNGEDEVLPDIEVFRGFRGL